MHKDRSTVSAVLDGIVVESIVVDSLPMCMYRRRLSLRSGFESESTSRVLSCLTGLFCNGNVAVHKDRIIVGAVLNGIIVDLTVVDGIAVGGRAVEEIVEDGTVADRIKADGGVMDGIVGEVGGWGRDPKICTGRHWGMGSSTI